MRTERMLWGLATGCAVLLLFAPFTPRTFWLPTARSAGAGKITEGVGWLAIATFMGMAALGALIIALRARRHATTATGAAVATIAFAVTAVGMGRHWIDLRHGITSLHIHPGEPWELHPAPLVPVFAVVAAIGAACAFALTIGGFWSETGTDVGATLEERAR